ncbi:MAG: hypothetical protein ACOYKE_13580 [Ferruginibacter sp.]
MKKISFFALLILAAGTIAAQSMEDIEKLVILGQDQKAREMLDTHLAVEKNAKKAIGWFYKGYVYNNLSRDSSISTDASDKLKWEAFEAFKKYRTMDAKAEKLAENNNAFFFDIYAGYLNDIGVRAYQNKEHANALAYFKRAVDVHDYLFANSIAGPNGFKFSGFDTVAILYCGIAAKDGKMLDEAATWYKKIVDAGVSDQQYIDAYYYLTDLYIDKKDKANFDDVVGKGRKAFPDQHLYWDESEIDFYTKGVAEPEVFGKYDELLTKFPTNYVLHYNFSVRMKRFIDNADTSSAQAKAALAATKIHLPEVLKKAIAINSTIEANYVMAEFLFNDYFDIMDEKRKVKGVKPEDMKKKKDIEARALQSSAASIPYAEAVESIFPGIKKPKDSEKRFYKEAMRMLKVTYERKGDAAKVTAYEKKYNEAE